MPGHPLPRGGVVTALLAAPGMDPGELLSCDEEQPAVACGLIRELGAVAARSPRASLCPALSPSSPFANLCISCSVFLPPGLALKTLQRSGAKFS